MRLSIHLSVCLHNTYLPILCLSILSSVHLSIHPSIHPSIHHSSVHLLICTRIALSVFLSVGLSVACLSIVYSCALASYSKWLKSINLTSIYPCISFVWEAKSNILVLFKSTTFQRPTCEGDDTYTLTNWQCNPTSAIAGILHAPGLDCWLMDSCHTNHRPRLRRCPLDHLLLSMCRICQPSSKVLQTITSNVRSH